MKLRSYLYGLSALIGSAFCVPASAQEVPSDDCVCVHEAIPENPYEIIPPNPFCLDDIIGDVQDGEQGDDQDSDQHTQLQEDELLLDLGEEIILPNLNQYFPAWQRSAGMTSLRLELPNRVSLNLFHKQIEFGSFTIGTHDKYLWRGDYIHTYIDSLDRRSKSNV